MELCCIDKAIHRWCCNQAQIDFPKYKCENSYYALKGLKEEYNLIQSGHGKEMIFSLKIFSLNWTPKKTSTSIKSDSSSLTESWYIHGIIFPF